MHIPFRYLLPTAIILVFILGACMPAAPTSTIVVNSTAVGPSVTATEDLYLQASPTTENATVIPTQEKPTNQPAFPPSVKSFPDPAPFQWVEVAKGFSIPVDLKSTSSQPGRLYVVEKPGRIQIMENGQVPPYPFLDITDRVGASGNEQGLLGLDFDPAYIKNGFFYVNYTDLNDNTVISRFKSNPTDDTRADSSSEEILLQVDQPYANHNGGGVVFGPEGYLYLSLGDGGSGGDPLGNGQNLNTFLGKILRIDISGGQGYTIPADNPFVTGGGLPEIWAYGLRNSWRFSFDAATSDLYIADVGQNIWEEVDFQAAGTPGGVNYGWNIREGAHPYVGKSSDGLNLVDPVFDYKHGKDCSITGGYVYRGSMLPEFAGIYIFGDFCSGTVWGLIKTDGGWQTQELFQTSAALSSFGIDSSGELYLLDLNGGRLLRLERIP